jgi:hypothetical protein
MGFERIVRDEGRGCAAVAMHGGALEALAGLSATRPHRKDQPPPILRLTAAEAAEKLRRSGRGRVAGGASRSVRRHGAPCGGPSGA